MSRGCGFNFTNMNITIEKGVEFKPEPSNAKYPWDDMDVGDSFFFADRKVVAAACSRNQRNKSKKFVTRQVEGGFRVWRVK